MSSAACRFVGVAYVHNPGVCVLCGTWDIPVTGWRGWCVRARPSCSWRGTPRMSAHLCCRVCVWMLGAACMMTLACHGVAQGALSWVLKALVGALGTARVRVADMGSSPSGVIVAPCTVRKRWWRCARSVQVSGGSLTQWRQKAWSPRVISCLRSVLLWTTHPRGRSRCPLRSRMVRCCGMNSILVMACARGSWWGRYCGAFVACSPALIVAKMCLRVGEGGGVWR